MVDFFANQYGGKRSGGSDRVINRSLVVDVDGLAYISNILQTFSEYHLAYMPLCERGEMKGLMFV